MANISSLGTARTEESALSAVSWGPIIGGALAASAVTLILIFVGSGLGLTMVSPWSYSGASATTFAVSAVIWLLVIQWISSGVGGYIAGRLRTRWVNVHDDEIYFRDTAHGFLTWALATLLVTMLAGSHVAAAIGAGTQAVSNVASGAAMGASAGAAANADKIGGAISSGSDYFVDTLFRPAAPAAGAAAGATTAPAASTASPSATAASSSPQGAASAETQASRILLNSAMTGNLPAEDKTYLGQLVAQRTGMPQADAEKRVDALLAQVDQAKTKAKEAADTARKAGVTVSLLSALSLVVGAFIASVAALLGGRRRDEYDTVVVSR